MVLVLGLLGLTIGGALFIILKVDLNQPSTGLIYQTIQGAPRLEPKSPHQLYNLAVLAVLTTSLACHISYRLYHQDRYLSYLLLGLSLVVLVFNLFVANALLSGPIAEDRAISELTVGEQHSEWRWLG